MTPSIAALLGRWFWWPQQVRPRPASALLRPVGPRPLVRSSVAEGLANARMSSEHPRPPFIARTIRRFSLLIILAWLVLILISTLASVGGNWSSQSHRWSRSAEKHPFR